MPRNCTTHQPDGCVHCPAIPAVQAVPAHYDAQPVVGWNAGANSIAELAGNLRAEFEPGV